MAIPAGTYRFGPENATLSVRTSRTGAAAKAGHNLLFHVGAWEATLTVGEGGGGALELSADGGSLQLIEGTGGLQSLGDDDRASIAKTVDEEVLERRAITFRSSDVQPAGDGLRVEGELALRGTTGPLGFDVAVGDGGRLSAAATVKQTAFGMKPYSTLWGALKVVDEVEVALDADRPPDGLTAQSR